MGSVRLFQILSEPNRTEPKYIEYSKIRWTKKNLNIFSTHSRNRSILAKLYPRKEPLWFHIGLPELKQFKKL